MGYLSSLLDSIFNEISSMIGLKLVLMPSKDFGGDEWM
jgi:hypothetical protein